MAAARMSSGATMRNHAIDVACCSTSKAQTHLVASMWGRINAMIQTDDFSLEARVNGDRGKMKSWSDVRMIFMRYVPFERPNQAAQLILRHQGGAAELWQPDLSWGK